MNNSPLRPHGEEKTCDPEQLQESVVAEDQDATDKERDEWCGVVFSKLSACTSDLRLAQVLFFIAAFFTLIYMSVWMDGAQSKGLYSYRYFFPSLMMAEGNGFGEDSYINLDNSPVLKEFFKTDGNLNHVPWGVLPRNDEHWCPPNYVAGPQGYFYWMASALWWFFGISWRSIAALHALLCGVAIVGAYGLLRQGMNKVLAFSGSLVFLLSPNHLAWLPYSREYAKTPFFLVAIMLMVLLVRKRFPRTRFLAMSALLGLTIGVGQGFRRDLLICLPIALFTVLCFVPGKWKETWGRRLGAVLLVIVMSYAAGWPAVATKSVRNASSAAVALFGMLDRFDSQLGIQNSTGHKLLLDTIDQDYYLEATQAAQAHYIYGASEPFRDGTVPSSLQLRHLIDIGCIFPADYTVRVWRTMDYLLRFCPSDYRHMPVWANIPTTNAFFDRTSQWFAPLLVHVARYGTLYALIFLLGCWTHSLRLGFAATALTMFFTGYGVIQPYPKNVFHLSIIPIFFLGTLVHAGMQGMVILHSNDGCDKLVETFSCSWRRGLVGCAVLLFIPFLTVAGTTAVQQHTVLDLYDRYMESELEELSYTVNPYSASKGSVLLSFPDLFTNPAFPGEAQWEVQARLLVVRVDNTLKSLRFRTSYFDQEQWFFNGRVTGHSDLPGKGDVMHFIPLYIAPEANTKDVNRLSRLSKSRAFEGLIVHEEDLPHIRGVYSVKNLSELPLILTAALPAENWTDVPRRLSLAKKPLPQYLRGWTARKENLLSNGDFERWDGNGTSPRFCDLPEKHSVITPTTEHCARGKFAALQTWNAPDAWAPLDKKFQIFVSDLKPNTAYELFVQVKAPLQPDRDFDSPWVRIEAYGISNDWANSPTPAVPLSRWFINRRLGYGFVDYSGRFTTGDTFLGEDSVTVVLATALLPSKDNPYSMPVEVVWDDWRLSEAPH